MRVPSCNDYRQSNRCIIINIHTAPYGNSVTLFLHDLGRPITVNSSEREMITTFLSLLRNEISA